MRLPVFIATFLLSFSMTAQNNVMMTPSQKDRMIAIEKSGMHARFEASSVNNSGNYDVKYYRLRLNVDPAVHYIEGSVTIYFEATVAGNLFIELDLLDSLTVDSLKYGGATKTFTHQNNKLIFETNMLAEGDLDSVTVYYQGVPGIKGSRAFVTDMHDSIPVMWTLSEPNGAFEWWPCKQTLDDKADSIDLFITAPSQYSVAGNGLLVREELLPGGFKISHWKHRYPITSYLVAFAVTNYVRYDQKAELGNGLLLVQNLIYPEDEERFKPDLDITLDLMHYYDSVLIPYPFLREKYGHAQFGWGGGMEHQTMSFMHDFNYELVAHEMAHSWFGNLITCATWNDIWLNEGITSYFTGAPYETFFDGYYWQIWKELQIEKITKEPDGSVTVFDPTDERRIFDSRLSYAKGSYVVHMLRWLMGDEVFYTAMRNYLTNPELVHGYATTAQFMRVMEETSGLSLAEFTNDWLINEGYPSYYLLWEYNNGKVLLNLSQTTSDPSVDFFEMPVPVRLIGNHGDAMVIINHTHNEQLVEIPIGFRVKEVVFDPEKWLLSKNNVVVSSVADGRVVIYPNPASEILNVEVGSNREFITSFQLLSGTGRLVDHDENINVPGVLEIPLKQISPGTYLLILVTNKGKYAKRVVVSN